jgi:hypothetical protein
VERGPISLVSIIEELLGRKTSGSGLENRCAAIRIRNTDHATPLYPQKLALTSTSCGRSVGIFRSRTEATEFMLLRLPQFPSEICVKASCLLVSGAWTEFIGDWSEVCLQRAVRDMCGAEVWVEFH